MRKIGWKPEAKFQEAMRDTIQWYKDNLRWIQDIKNRGANLHYMQRIEMEDIRSAIPKAVKI